MCAKNLLAKIIMLDAKNASTLAFRRLVKAQFARYQLDEVCGLKP